MLRSLRSHLIVASVLWTAGLLALMHILFMAAHRFPGMSGSLTAEMLTAGFVFMLAGFGMARQSLVPFRRLRGKLAAMRTGQEIQVKGVYPSEIQPLIDDLNTLLRDREKAVNRAIATAGDLAHGLKTPLAVLAQEAERARASGDAELGESIAHQVERMSRQVNYQLARARATAFGTSGAAPCPVAACAGALVRTVSKLYAHRGLTLSVEVPDELHARMHREDLEEVLGNLLDNACKWANRTVRLQASRSASMLTLRVEDDGPGLPAEMRAAVLERGVRLDEAAAGSGLGLAIVRDLAELYGGSVSLGKSSLGGLCVQVMLPVGPLP